MRFWFSRERNYRRPTPNNLRHLALVDFLLEHNNVYYAGIILLLTLHFRLSPAKGERASAQIPKHPELMTTSRKIFLDVSTFEEKALFDFSHD
jgi:hypothetical protein